MAGWTRPRRCGLRSLRIVSCRAMHSYVPQDLLQIVRRVLEELCERRQRGVVLPDGEVEDEVLVQHLELKQAQRGEEQVQAWLQKKEDEVELHSGFASMMRVFVSPNPPGSPSRRGVACARRHRTKVYSPTSCVTNPQRPGSTRSFPDAWPLGSRETTDRALVEPALVLLRASHTPPDRHTAAG